MKPGAILLVKFPFSDLASTKKRPAMLLAHASRSPRNRLVTVAMITSKVESLGYSGDVLLQHWEHAGLLHPSLLRLGKVATLDANLVEGTIGELSRGDLRRAKTAFRQVFAAWK